MPTTDTDIYAPVNAAHAAWQTAFDAVRALKRLGYDIQSPEVRQAWDAEGMAWGHYTAIAHDAGIHGTCDAGCQR